MELGGLGSNSTSTMSQLCGLGQITQPLCSPHKLGVGGSYHNTSHMRAKHLNNSIKYLNSKGCGCCHPDYKSAPVSLEVNRRGPAACSCPLLSEPLSGGLVDPTRAGEGPWWYAFSPPGTTIPVASWFSTFHSGLCFCIPAALDMRGTFCQTCSFTGPSQGQRTPLTCPGHVTRATASEAGPGGQIAQVSADCPRPVFLHMRCS